MTIADPQYSNRFQSQLLGLSRLELDRFLKEHNIYDHAYDMEDLERDQETMRQLEAQGLLLRP